MLEKHLLRRHGAGGGWGGGSGPRGRGGVRREVKESTGGVSNGLSCGRRAVRGSWGNVGEVGPGHGREDAFGSV